MPECGRTIHVNGSRGITAMDSMEKLKDKLDEFVVNIGSLNTVNVKSNSTLLQEYIDSTFRSNIGPVLNGYTPVLELEMTKEKYDEIIATKYTLRRAIMFAALAVAKYVAVNKIKKDINLMAEGFCLLIRASQRFYPPKNPKGIAIMKVAGITTTIRRRTNDLEVQSFLPVISFKDTGLVWKVIRHHHSDNNESKIHFSSDRVVARIATCSYAIFCSKINMITRLFEAGCGVCNMTKDRKIKHEQGKRLKGVEGHECMYKSVCLDTIGPFRVAQAINSQYIKKVYALICVDLFSGLVSSFIINDVSSKSIAAALLALQARVGTNIRHIYSDNASYFRQGILS